MNLVIPAKAGIQPILFAVLFLSTAPALAADLCALLAPADFAAAGITGAKAPTRNGDGNDAYCVYAGKSSASGGIELDVFIAPDANEAKVTYAEVRGPPGKTPSLTGVDQADVSQVPGPPAYTAISVRKGKLVFGIGVPANAKSQDAVAALAKLVLQRGEAYAK
jgi:hypothetical protein